MSRKCGSRNNIDVWDVFKYLLAMFFWYISIWLFAFQKHPICVVLKVALFIELFDRQYINIKARHISRIRNNGGNDSTVHTLHIYNHIAEYLNKYIFLISKEVIVFPSRSYRLEAILLVANIDNSNIISQKAIFQLVF